VPIHEANHPKSRDRFPLAFDLEGVPRETADRERLLASQIEERSLNSAPAEGEPFMTPVTNSFAVDYAAGNSVIDINNPPRKPYNPHDPKNEFPKMLYNHETGKVLTVASTKEEQVAIKKHGFKREPAPDREYHLAKSGMVAPMKQEAEPREEAMIAQELADIENDD
jgi:hypothetical protein